MFSQSSEKGLVGTVTGEVHQPIRLYYEMYEPKKTLAALSKLKCIQRDPTRNRLVWVYEKEAKSLKFPVSYNEMNPELRPIVLGSFVVKPKNILICDVRSIKRALSAITFFDRYISRDHAKVLNLAILNRYSQVHEDNGSCYDRLFDDYPKKIQPFDFDALFDSVKDLADPSQKALFLYKHMQKIGEKPLDEIETIPTKFYENGINALKSILVIRDVMANKHFFGDDLSLSGLIESIISID